MTYFKVGPETCLGGGGGLTKEQGNHRMVRPRDS